MLKPPSDPSTTWLDDIVGERRLAGAHRIEADRENVERALVRIEMALVGLRLGKIGAGSTNRARDDAVVAELRGDTAVDLVLDQVELPVRRRESPWSQTAWSGC